MGCQTYNIVCDDTVSKWYKIHASGLLAHGLLLPLRALDHAVPGQAEVPAWAEEEDALWCPIAPSAGTVLCGSASPAALHNGDEDEDDDDERQT